MAGDLTRIYEEACVARNAAQAIMDEIRPRIDPDAIGEFMLDDDALFVAPVPVVENPNPVAHCPSSKMHDPHEWGDGDVYHCPGMPF